MDSQELYDQAFERLDAIVQAAGGPEALMENPEDIPPKSKKSYKKPSPISMCAAIPICCKYKEIRR